MSLFDQTIGFRLSDMNRTLRTRLDSLAISTSDILLPKKEVDPYFWAVIACDQFTSQKDYWHKVELATVDHPSTYNLIYPECFLEDEDRMERIKSINRTMDDYLKRGIFDTYKDCFILVERSTVSGTRYGLMVSLDLENYSYAKDSKSLVRATEGTILSRIPPRKEIRKNASLELPHIMVLINDIKRLVIEPLVAKRAELKCIYDTELMLGGGHLKGYLVSDEKDIEAVVSGLEDIKAHLDPMDPLLYAMGDGNHSLATAKSLYEDLKKEKGKEALSSPFRHALVELENIYDPALCFEAIHRVFFNTDPEDLEAEIRKNCDSFTKEETGSLEDLEREVNRKDGNVRFGLITGGTHFVYTLSGCPHALAASVIQSCIDSIASSGKGSVDYIHGSEVVGKIASEEGNIGIILPDISKETFFKSIIRDGSFPRKTFSIGHAEEKRYYMEARRIR